MAVGWPFGRAKQHVGERQEVPKSQTRKGPSPISSRHAIHHVHRLRPHPLSDRCIDQHLNSSPNRMLLFCALSAITYKNRGEPEHFCPAPLSKPPTRTWPRTLNQYTILCHLTSTTNSMHFSQGNNIHYLLTCSPFTCRLHHLHHRT